LKKKIGLIFMINIMVLFVMAGISYAASKTGTYGVLPPMSVHTDNESELLTRRSATGEWIQDTSTGGWKYKFPDGTYATDEWIEVDRRWYHFDDEGWMQTGWFEDLDGNIYYLHVEEGYMMIRWVQDNGKWYYMDDHGVLVKGWVEYEGDSYYMRESDGAMVTGSSIIDGLTYYFNTSSGVKEQCYINLIRRSQEETKWCWAASAEMIGKYVNPSSTLSQGDVATSIAGLGLLDEPNFSAWFPAARKAVELFSEDEITGAYIYGDPMGFSLLAQNIDIKCPVLAYLSWDWLTGHDVVISGYHVDEKIRIVDPWEDTPTAYVPYLEAITGYQFYTGYGTYENSIYIER